MIKIHEKINFNFYQVCINLLFFHELKNKEKDNYILNIFNLRFTYIK